MTREALGIASIGLSIHDEVVLRSLLGIIRGKTTADWQQVSPPEADLLLVAAHALPSVPAGDRRLLICLESAASGSRSLHGEHLALHAPLRVMPLMFALNRAADKLAAPATRTTRSAAEDAPQAHVATLPIHPLSNALSKAPRTSATSITSADGEALLWIDWRGGRYLSTSPLRDLWDRHASGNVLLRQEQNVPNTAAARPLAELLLQAATHVSLDGGALLLPPMRPHEHFQLTRWPDADVLRESADFVRLCGMLSRRALTLREAAATSRLGEARVIAFFNLMSLLGLLRLETAPATVAAGNGKRRGGMSSQLVSMIRRCLHVGAVPVSAVRHP